MSSSSNSRIADGAPSRGRAATPNNAGALTARRRRLLLALFGAALGLPVFANIDPTTGLKRWGSGEFRRFGFLVYEATLWAGDDPQLPPLALRLDYKRNLAGRAIAEASVKEMRALIGDDARLKRWGEQMAALFTDVQAGDFIVGHYRADGAAFIHNGRPLGEIADPEFARAFFGIWLDPRTSAPGLRARLLTRSVA